MYNRFMKLGQSVVPYALNSQKKCYTFHHQSFPPSNFFRMGNHFSLQLMKSLPK